MIRLRYSLMRNVFKAVCLSGFIIRGSSLSIGCLREPGLGQRKIMLAFVQILFQGVQDHLQMLFVAEKISAGDIDEYGLDIMLTDIMGISLLDIEKVFVR